MVGRGEYEKSKPHPHLVLGVRLIGLYYLVSSLGQLAGGLLSSLLENTDNGVFLLLWGVPLCIMSAFMTMHPEWVARRMRSREDVSQSDDADSPRPDFAVVAVAILGLYFLVSGCISAVSGLGQVVMTAVTYDYFGDQGFGLGVLVSQLRTTIYGNVAVIGGLIILKKQAAVLAWVQRLRTAGVHPEGYFPREGVHETEPKNG